MEAAVPNVERRIMAPLRNQMISCLGAHEAVAGLLPRTPRGRLPARGEHRHTELPVRHNPDTCIQRQSSKITYGSNILT